MEDISTKIFQLVYYEEWMHVIVNDWGFTFICNNLQWQYVWILVYFISSEKPKNQVHWCSITLCQKNLFQLTVVNTKSNVAVSYCKHAIFYVNLIISFSFSRFKLLYLLFKYLLFKYSSDCIKMSFSFDIFYLIHLSLKSIS